MTEVDRIIAGMSNSEVALWLERFGRLPRRRGARTTAVAMLHELRDERVPLVGDKVMPEIREREAARADEAARVKAKLMNERTAATKRKKKMQPVKPVKRRRAA